jgi:HK97 gp10 family phage protein
MGQTTVKILENNTLAIRKSISGDALLKAVTAGGEVLRGAIRIKIRETFNRHPTGNLMNSINIETDHADAHSAAVNVGTNVIYAVIHEFGGIIRAKNAPYLHFVIDGRHIFTKVVHMPARPYMRPAVDENREAIFETIANQIKKQIERAAT